MQAISITVDGVTVWQAGMWPSIDEAMAWMDKHDDLIGDIVTDLTNEHREADPDPNYWPDVDVTVTWINTVEELSW
jgi:hypothetical protein